MKITVHKAMSMFQQFNMVDGNDAAEACRRLDEFLEPPAPSAEVTAIVLQSPAQEIKKGPKPLIYLVAGRGFEPLTFGL
jgi:hypothetical protein